MRPRSAGRTSYVSEIGLVVDDVAAAAATVATAAALTPYESGSDEVAALGDPYGLVILMKRGKTVDLSSSDAAVFRTAVTLRAGQTGRRRLDGYPYDILLEERCTCR